MPPASSDASKHADWLELETLTASDGNVSFQDMVAELRRDGSTDAIDESLESLVDRGGESTQRIADAAFSELEDRVRAAGDGYPFSLGAQDIQLRPGALEGGSTYLFMLLLSWFGVSAGKGSHVRPERDFEDISQAAAASYFGHNEHDGSYLFAFPRRTKAKGFPDAVDQLSRELGEGGGIKLGPLGPQQKDAHLDIVVWHGFADKRPGQLIAFGQCATGENWTTKLTELPPPSIWCRAWMLKPPSVSAVRMFFVPNRLSQAEWETRAILGGIIFDRCRIAYHAPQVPVSIRKRAIRWSKTVMEGKLAA